MPSSDGIMTGNKFRAVSIVIFFEIPAGLSFPDCQNKEEIPSTLCLQNAFLSVPIMG
jgi:hypothetical protein